ncbi:MAG TPA: hypothetical protein VLM40_09705 [Gemmata sp.]|nr:hypothetical protein [Gemmata sp.]
MPATTRAKDALRARLGVEDLEGRAMPGAAMAGQTPFEPGVYRVASGDQGVYVLGAAVATQLHSPAAIRVVSRIVVNGQQVMKFVGRPHFAAIAPALSTDASGHPIEVGGTTVSVNGQVIGTFAGNPTVTRDATFHVNRYGIAARVLTFHVDGPVYVAPPDNIDRGI